MSNIRFYIPEYETIPIDLRLYVDDVYVNYERIKNGFIFHILLEDEHKALQIANEIIAQIIFDHEEPTHGISWRTTSLEIMPQDERYKIGTDVMWKYRVRDSY